MSSPHIPGDERALGAAPTPQRRPRDADQPTVRVKVAAWLVEPEFPVIVTV